MTQEHYDQREALYESGNWPSAKPAPARRINTPAQAEWDDGGEAVNLRAAAEDADEWLDLIQRLNAAGKWKFSQADSAGKLAGCRAALRRMLGPK